jgi:hypothetical protein
MMLLNLFQIPGVVSSDMNGVMTQVVASFNAKLHHKRRAGKSCSLKFFIAPGRPQSIRNQSLRCTSEVGISFQDHVTSNDETAGFTT